jgi:hypothetical protein
VLKQITGDTHANVQVKVKELERHKRNINAQENIRLGFRRTSLQRELDRKAATEPKVS